MLLNLNGFIVQTQMVCQERFPCFTRHSRIALRSLTAHLDHWQHVECFVPMLYWSQWFIRYITFPLRILKTANADMLFIIVQENNQHQGYAVSCDCHHSKVDYFPEQNVLKHFYSRFKICTKTCIKICLSITNSTPRSLLLIHTVVTINDVLVS